MSTRVANGVPAAIVLEHIGKTFPRTYRVSEWLKHAGRVPRWAALRDVSFRVNGGEIFGLLGANGAGKSTLLRVLAGLVVPSSGRAALGGLDLADQPSAVRRRVGFSSGDDRSFYYRLTARQNLRFFGALAGLRGGSLEQRIAEMACLIGLERHADVPYGRLSSGMRQRLSIGRALLHDPDVLLLDEPTRALDPLHARAIRAMLRDEFAVRRGKTIVVATNTLDEVHELCDRVAFLRDGCLVSVGPAQRVLDEVDRLYALTPSVEAM